MGYLMCIVDFSSFKLFASGVCVYSAHVGHIPHLLGSLPRREQTTVPWCVLCRGRVQLTAPYWFLPSSCSLGLFCTLLAGWLADIVCPGQSSKSARCGSLWLMCAGGDSKCKGGIAAKRQRKGGGMKV